MNHRDQLIFVQSPGCSRFMINHRADRLQFEEVISAAERAQGFQPALCTLRDIPFFCVKLTV